MDEDLPNKFDLVVVGTGFVESVVAAAASRIGKTVLHVDSNDFYGGCWASFNLESFQNFLSSAEENGVLSAKQKWSVSDADESENDWTQTELLKISRKFNIDLVPKLIFSTGTLVDLLVSSNICRYAEFRSVDKVLTFFEGDLLSVPCSRTDVFNTKVLSIVEKRLLMKLLMNSVNYESNADELVKYQGKTLLEYLEANNLSKKVIHCVINSIVMCDGDVPVNVGIEKMNMYIRSLGKYGNSPFLYPMYGCGEIPQCFCRLCAVFGGIYCLKKKIDLLRVEDEQLTLDLDGQIINCNHLVASNAWLAQRNIIGNVNERHRCGNLARGVLITSTPIGNEEQNAGGGGVNIIRLTEGSDSGRAAILLQTSHHSGTCPKGLYLIHITSESVSDDPEADLEPFIKQICDDSTNKCTKILYSAFFLIAQCTLCKSEGVLPEPNSQQKRIYSACGPFFGIDYDMSIQNARNIFNSIYTGESFLPRAPDPEEIIIGDEDPIALIEHCLPDDLKSQISSIEQQMDPVQ